MNIFFFQVAKRQQQEEIARQKSSAMLFTAVSSLSIYNFVCVSPRTDDDLDGNDGERREWHSQQQRLAKNVRAAVPFSLFF